MFVLGETEKFRRTMLTVNMVDEKEETGQPAAIPRSQQKFLIVGLGNPGRRHRETPVARRKGRPLQDCFPGGTDTGRTEGAAHRWHRKTAEPDLGSGPRHLALKHGNTETCNATHVMKHAPITGHMVGFAKYPW